MAEPTVPLSLHDAKVQKMAEEIGKLNEQLERAETKIRWFHTRLKLRATIEVAEIKYKPTTISNEEYASKTRRQKWDLILSEEVFPEFKLCVSAIEDADISRLINDMYGVLNSRIHRYLCSDDIDDTNFKDDKLNQLSKCIEILNGRLM